MEHTYLVHHGTLGQKWGIRKYQNPDGSLTPAGKLRYYKGDGTPTRAGKKYEKKLRKAKREEEKRKAKEEKQKSEEAAKNRFKPAYEMTEEELRQSISKMQLEKEYNSLIKDLTPEQKVTLGDRIKSAAGDALVDGIKKGGAQFLTNYMAKKGEYLGTNKGYTDKTERIKALNTKAANENAKMANLLKESKWKQDVKDNRETNVDYNKVNKAVKEILNGKDTKKLAKSYSSAELDAAKARIKTATSLSSSTNSKTSNTKSKNTNSNANQNTNSNANKNTNSNANQNTNSNTKSKNTNSNANQNTNSNANKNTNSNVNQNTQTVSNINQNNVNEGKKFIYNTFGLQPNKSYSSDTRKYLFRNQNNVNEGKKFIYNTFGLQPNKSYSSDIRKYLF